MNKDSKLAMAEDGGNGNEKNIENDNEDAVVTPELLVDALSGHEDGLLAIAERLMEHYEGGYDVMGEAIIDAFADVQKLFQHVVEAAHMEGAAFESSRREAELQQQTAINPQSAVNEPDANINTNINANTSAMAPLTRHDEFIDQDVRDILSQAIQKGQAKIKVNQAMECYELYEEACNSASALLPVDSDHRGRLQLSIARAESMSPDRACAILRYAMDDVLRSGQTFSLNQPRPKKQPTDFSKRGDCVLKSSEAELSSVVHQSHEEALNSLVEEMKEVLGAPVYENTPVQEVAMRFWFALEEAQKNGKKKEETLEKELGQLKGEYLLARAEWEEKLSTQTTQADTFKKKYYTLKEQVQQYQYMDHARSSAHRIAESSNSSNDNSGFGGIQSVFSGDASDGLCSSSVNRCSPKQSKKKTDKDFSQNSVASFGSVLGHHARSLVGSFGCAGGANVDPHPTNQFLSNRSTPPPSVTSATDSQNGASRYRRSAGNYSIHRMGSRDI